MKICYLITKSRWGGAGRYVYDLATYFHKKQHDVTVICGGTGELTERCAGKKIRVISLPSLQRDISIVKDLRSFIITLKILKRERPDIIHVNSSKMGLMGTIAGRLARIPCIIFTAHGWPFHETRPRWQKVVFYTLAGLTVLLSHKTIAVSDKTKKALSSFPFVSKKIEVIYNGITPFRPLSRKKAREEIGIQIPEGNTVVMTIAELHPNKGLLYSLHAFSLLIPRHPLSYVIIGDGEQKTLLLRFIKEHKLQNHVFLVGHKKDASQYLSLCDIFLLPSLTEAMPYVILEAGYLGKPVIATGVGGVPDVIHDMSSGVIIRRKSISEIKNALTYMLENKKEAREMGRALKGRIHVYFSFTRTAAQTERLYERCLKKNP